MKRREGKGREREGCDVSAILSVTRFLVLFRFLLSIYLCFSFSVNLSRSLSLSLSSLVLFSRSLLAIGVLMSSAVTTSSLISILLSMTLDLCLNSASIFALFHMRNASVINWTTCENSLVSFPFLFW